MKRIVGIGAGIAVTVLMMTASSAAAENQDALKDMEVLIKKQQEQIDAQARELKTLSEKVETFTEKESTGDISKSNSSGSMNKNLKLYGQVNRGVLYSNDGDKDYVYQVDNSNSSTRFGIDATAEKNGIVTGAKIEVELQSNASSKVNQHDRRSVGDGHFQKRHMDVFAASKKLGKLSIGHGSTASDGTSEVDLSGTSVVSYSSVHTTAGGQYFFEKTSGALDTDVTIGKVMNNMDGLGRDDRVRYDSPTCHGLGLSASYIANGGGDAALKYSTDTDQFKVAAALSFANPGSASGSVDDQYSGSVSALHTSGVNLTLAGGSQSYKADGKDDGAFFYGKVGYLKDFFSTGATALALDYGMFNELNTNNDKADTIGATLVQNFSDWSTEFYLCYRLHTLDRDGADYEDINTVFSGLRVKF